MLERVVRVVVREEGYKGIVCVFICEEDGSVYLEIKEPGVKEKKIVKFNKYLKIIERIVA
ncbi:hypothetical protein [[Clostridium] fimetarium]|uniref:Uncharacterized protein n=1 Tax=[Clostridium] fimetarium TaxID=99656 RepID=A0A1I0NEJ8_9FIRM|nr:hypothetical protein [[Clostridium] fimetarium]SEV99649.1 hypothetical protein SAMN05421659_10339 [[Clostridium] fimetarium]